LFTSNLGVREAIETTEDSEKRKEIILEAVKANLRPELYNRISQVIAFNSLSEPELERIVGVQLSALVKKLAEDRDIKLEVTPEALAYLAAQSYDPAYGARPVGRTMQQLVLSPVATAVLAGDVAAGQTLTIHHSVEEGLTFSVPEAAATA
jgi:ATP-dependent Clp protease ATP-binding subunit ClpB